jgi:hypothetical protein
MSEITVSAVPSCVPDISMGRIWWELHERCWVAVVKPCTVPAQKRHDDNLDRWPRPPSQTGETASLCGTCPIGVGLILYSLSAQEGEA